MSITLNDEKLTGLILASMSNTIPEGFLLCDGSAINRNTYSSLFALSPSTTSIITMTIASPCVVTWNNHGLATGQSIQFSTDGALPTFSTVQTVYFIRVINTNTFNLYNTLSNAMNTSATTGRVNTSGTQSGSHTGLVYYWGNGDGSTTFNIPDGRGTYLRGVGSPTSFLDSTNYDYTIGQKINDTLQNLTGSFSSNTHRSVPSLGGVFLGSASEGTNVVADGAFVYQRYTINFNSSNSSGARTGTETRVKSVAVNYFIKY